MRQVPYCVIGNGQLAKHLRHWCSLMGCDFVHWHRQQADSALESCVQAADVIILAITDACLSEFSLRLSAMLELDQCLVHCSGSQSISGAWGCHPMMTFGDHLYALKDYQDIVWVVDHDAPVNLMSHFITHRLPIHPDQKSLYHAWCVLAGNGTSLLWQQCVRVWQQEFSWTEKDAKYFAEACLKTGLSGDQKRLSGPMIRGDEATISNNLSALGRSSEKACYKALNQIAEDLR